MTIFRKNNTPSVQLTVICALPWILALFPTIVNAQSVDQCMAASKQQAVTICSNIINNGSRNADVYWQLAAQLYQVGSVDESDKVLTKALSIHPGHRKLINLRNNIQSASEEERQLKAARQKNQSRVSQGKLKITCLTKTSQAGLDACRQYLQQTSVDSQKINSRIAKLETELGSTIVAAEPVPEPPAEIKPETNTAAPRPQVTATTSTTNNSGVDRETARQIQSTLNALGFQTGTPDGIPGAKTRSAVAAFYDSTGLARKQSFDSAMLNDIRNEQALLNLSERKLIESRQLANQDPAQALSLLEEAQRASSLFVAPSGYRENLDIKMAQSESNAQEDQLAQQQLADRERKEAEQLAQLERDRQAREKAEQEKAEQLAQLERDRRAREKAEQEKAEQLAQLERDRRAREKAEQKKAEQLAQLERDRRAREKAEQEKAEQLALVEQQEKLKQAQNQQEADERNNRDQKAQEFTLLMRQIASLQKRLDDHQASINLQLNSIRSTVSDLFE